MSASVFEGGYFSVPQFKYELAGPISGNESIPWSHGLGVPNFR